MTPTKPRVALVTGAAGGIGRAMVAALLEAGHAVAAMDRDAAALDALRALHPDQPRLHALCADLGTEAGCAGTIADTLAHFGRIDALVNNAGIGVSSLRPDAETRLPAIEELDAATWDRFFAINLRAPMLLLRGALPHMRAAGWGRVVNNTTSFRTMLRVLPYGATKAALESASAIWAQELAGSGITVNVLIPGGPTDTPFISDATGWDRAAMLKPAIMGPPLAWLLSDAADGFTGHRIIAAGWSEATLAYRAIGWPELGADAVWLQGS
ncbi:SDR family NAD(P)-dependent oxidoreductase [Plastoroseomonas arctica]|uniref:SDR family oxidoreductase n=1 Tax=Plastoroseomonas arctica TaxID=1509237 RepID=A0AAF1JYL2_9PROT|nr:SDR family oxidoreductase [Plastoroseomonas arctica]MBR0653643.1 SDR family oxidoreductase [Plastoroseomonas arctica]